MPYLPISVSAAHTLAIAHEKDIVLIVGWDRESNKTNVVTWGREPEQKEAAAKGGKKVAACLGLEHQPTDTHEDYRREGEAAKEVDRLRAALTKAVRGIRAEMNDTEQQEAETLGKIEMRIDELAAALAVPVS